MKKYINFSLHKKDPEFAHLSKLGVLLEDIFAVMERNIKKFGPVSEIKVYHSKEEMKDGETGYNKDSFQARITYGE